MLKFKSAILKGLKKTYKYKCMLKFIVSYDIQRNIFFRNLYGNFHHNNGIVAFISKK